MKPTVQDISPQCPEVDEALVREHLERLDERYFERFDPPQIAEHLNHLATLSPKQPAEVLLRQEGDGQVVCTVLGFDYPAVFSLITGVMAGMGFGIISGDVFTYGPGTAKPRTVKPRHARRRTRRPEAPRRKIIDEFRGRVQSDEPFEHWAEQFKQRMTEVMTLTAGGDTEAVAQARQRVNEMVTQRLTALKGTHAPALYPVQVEVEKAGERLTRLTVISQDTPAFLYSLSAALSLHGLSIEHVRIRTTDDRIEDVIDVADASGGPIRDPALVDKLRLSVLLTKQFTYFLDQAPDPYTALSRFERLAEDILHLPDSGQWVERLNDPRAMQDLARLLGASDYLWEDFIRAQYEALAPILQPHVEDQSFSGDPEELAEKLRRAIDEAATLDDKRKALDRFKNNAIFRIDLDQILGRMDFRQFAERLTVLAELVITTAARLVYDHHVHQYGRPRTEDGDEATYCIAALGKLGGKAIGYASDLELIFIYRQTGRTDGVQPITNGEFYERCVSAFVNFLKAKREGIFDVDMRLRPHGDQGPLACSAQMFSDYFATGGAAHAVERLALVRLRTIGGDVELGRRIERSRDQFVYEGPAIDVAELSEARGRQFAEKCRPGDANAKYSPGALLDLEAAVQLLQVMHGRDAPAVRTPRIHKALDGLRSASVITPNEAAQMNDAYNFLRNLINALRMLRGSARDLLLPAEATDELIHLARRMGYVQAGSVDPAEQLSIALQLHTADVRAFVRRRLSGYALPDPTQANPADLILHETADDELAGRALAAVGLADVVSAASIWRQLAERSSDRRCLAHAAVVICQLLRRCDEPDEVLSRWQRLATAAPDIEHHVTQLTDSYPFAALLIEVLARSEALTGALYDDPARLDRLAEVAATVSSQDLPALEKQLLG